MIRGLVDSPPVCLELPPFWGYTPWMFALIALLAATSAFAHRLPDCLRTPSERASGTQSLADLRTCQDRVREDFRTKRDKKGALPTSADLDRLDEHQRAEARRLLAGSKEILGDDEAGPVKSRPGKLGGVTGRDLSRTDAKAAKILSDLQARIHAAAGDGQDGITPAMAEDIKQTLASVQGLLSPQMQALLGAVAKDGGTLTLETMKLLQNAAKDAKSEGLDLNIDAKTEKDLLEHDFDSDKSAAPPGTM